MGIRALALFVAVAASSIAADNSVLLGLASKGKTALMRSALDTGTSIEATDKHGRTPLMLAAQHGFPETVKLLLDRGANTAVRDKTGLTAYGLTLLEPEGHGAHEEVLKILPKPPRSRVALEAGWLPVKLISSCFMDRERLIGQISAFRLDGMVLDEIAEIAESPAGKNLWDLVRLDRLGMSSPPPSVQANVDAVLAIEAQPGAACAAQVDNLSLSIAVRVFQGADRSMILEKTFGGGLKGLHARSVNNPTQYEPVYEEWIKPHAKAIYWAVAEALLRNSR